MSDEAVTKTERIGGGLASAITIGNFAMACLGIQFVAPGVAVPPSPPVVALPLRVIGFAFLEVALSVAFALIVARVHRSLANLILSTIAANLVTLISAWLSIFNLQWLLIGPWGGFAGYDHAFFAFVFAAAVLSSLIHSAILMNGRGNSEGVFVSFVYFTLAVHTVPFGVMGVAVGLGQSGLGG